MNPEIDCLANRVADAQQHTPRGTLSPRIADRQIAERRDRIARAERNLASARTEDARECFRQEIADGGKFIARMLRESGR